MMMMVVVMIVYVCKSYASQESDPFKENGAGIGSLKSLFMWGLNLWSLG